MYINKALFKSDCNTCTMLIKHIINNSTGSIEMKLNLDSPSTLTHMTRGE